ncbi:MAG: hypothetical protein ABH875_07235 [Candidatus Omnitrophota bacterium]
MKTALAVLISLALLPAFAIPLSAEEDDLPAGISELPPGMSIIKVGTANIVAPIGSRVYKENTITIVEPIEQYAARKFLDIEARFVAIESRLKEMEKELQELTPPEPSEPLPADQRQSPSASPVSPGVRSSTP